MTTRGAGIGTAGPIISVSWILPLSIRRPRHALRGGDGEDSAWRFRQRRRAQLTIAVADAPEQFRIAEELRGEVVEAIAGDDAVRADQRETLRLRREAALEIVDLATVRQLIGLDAGRDVTAVRCERAHGIPVNPSWPSVPPGPRAASCSLRRR